MARFWVRNETRNDFILSTRVDTRACVLTVCDTWLSTWECGVAVFPLHLKYENRILRIEHTSRDTSVCISRLEAMMTEASILVQSESAELKAKLMFLQQTGEAQKSDNEF
ncbi:hypothetical protein EPI10_001550 [Gossypium australe]|uniref:Uncharacterized protein n=1 Tax=Gossypium australe TaxID=47621 RepID=A0A5B6VBE2_9ROSI|nr:hypothetical protein EPI10_001550 [Gossypium australe]